MKYLILPFLLIFQSVLMAQTADTNLYYRTTADSNYFGIQRGDGTWILPLEITNLFDYVNGEIFEEEVIDLPIFNTLIRNQLNQFNSISSVNTVVYNRQGELLYYPLFFDNGSDFFKEGFRRYVDVATGKVGFVNEHHQKVMPEQWQAATAFNYGYAKVYNGYSKEFLDAYKEHWTIVPTDTSAETFIINQQGYVVKGYKKPQHLLDYFDDIDSLYYPYPFTYTKEQQRVVDSINQMKVLVQLYLRNHYPVRNTINHNYRYEIIKENETYYYFEFYDHQQGQSRDMIRYDKYKKHFEVEQPYSKEGTWVKDYWIDLNEFILEELKEAQDYFKHHPDAPNRFDTQLALDHYSEIKKQ